MPIRINLLAEAHAAEETRRKDPVKRAILGGVLIICAVLVWSSTIQVKILASKSELNTLEATWKSMEKNYQAAVESRRKFLEAEEKLTALQNLTTNRFLWGTTLNAMAQTLYNVDDVQVTRIRADQTYTLADEIRKGAPKVPTATEKIIMTLEAMDSSPQPGAKINKFKASIAGEPYFQTNLAKTNGVALLSFSPPQMDAAGRNPFVRFSLQLLFPDKVRY